MGSPVKYLPALFFFIVAALCFIASRAGDNVDARALAGLMVFPGIVATGLGILAAAAAYLL